MDNNSVQPDVTTTSGENGRRSASASSSTFATPRGGGGGGVSDSSSTTTANNNTPYSTIPFGSPIVCSNRSILSPSPRSSSTSTGNPLFNRLRGQELYGGTIKFGGLNSSLRNLSSHRSSSSQRDRTNPYSVSSSLRSKRQEKQQKLSNFVSSSNSSSTNSSSTNSAPLPLADGLSSTAKLILDTLDRMPTPLRDAQKIPLSYRADKRKLIEEELNSSLLETPGSSLRKRRRPRLGNSGPWNSTTGETVSNTTGLNGPPVRTIFSPVILSSSKTKEKSPPASITATTTSRKETVEAFTPTARTSMTTATSMTSVNNFGLSAFSVSNDYESNKSSVIRGGKIRAKVSDIGRARTERKKLREEEEALPPPPVPLSVSNFSFKPEVTKSLSSKVAAAAAAASIDKKPPPSVKEEVKYTFSNPVIMEETQDLVEGASSRKFVFRAPIEVGGGGPETTEGPLLSSSNSLNNGHIPSSSLLRERLSNSSSNHKMMNGRVTPDVAVVTRPFTTFKKQTESSDQGSRNNKMLEHPPGTTLKQGSVMSILGGGSGDATWNSKFKMENGKPWN